MTDVLLVAGIVGASGGAYLIWNWREVRAFRRELDEDWDG